MNSYCNVDRIKPRGRDNRELRGYERPVKAKA